MLIYYLKVTHAGPSGRQNDYVAEAALFVRIDNPSAEQAAAAAGEEDNECADSRAAQQASKPAATVLAEARQRVALCDFYTLQPPLADSDTGNLLAAHFTEKPKRPREECTAPAKRTAVPKLRDCSAKKIKKPPPLITPLKGPELSEFMKKLEGAVSAAHPPGTRVWAKVAGSGRFPAVTWSFAACKRKDMGALITAYRDGLVCVRYYGEHSTMWVRDEDLEPPPEDESELQRQFKNWGRQRNKMRMVELALDEMLGTHAEPDKELRRMVMLYDQYLQTREALDNCYLCRELGARLECCVCDRLFHPLCLREPVVSEEELLDSCQGRWVCPCCGEDNKVREEVEGGEDDDRDEEWGQSPDKKQERLGLTPDWLIEAAAFHVFQLERPHARRPYIPRLLDPCTNSKLAPNIPAELLYDKRDNGLKLSNSWSGYYVLLNPDYSAQIQWRFVNRCIDEVENGQVPAAVLICRNSTDTAYFQRLRPYPRVMLRRMSARFKDYDKTPIGFGIAVFCITKGDCRQLYERFFDALEPMGEPNVPSDEYVRLLERLKDYAAVHHRDHWVQCSSCERWRIVGYEAALQLGDDDEWTCTMLDPPYSSCDTPLSKRELLGGRYAAGGADNLAGRGVPDEEGSLGAEEGQPAVKEEQEDREEKEEGGAASKGSLEQHHERARRVVKQQQGCVVVAAAAAENKAEGSADSTMQEAAGGGCHLSAAAPACGQPGEMRGTAGVSAGTGASAAGAAAQRPMGHRKQQQQPQLPQGVPQQAAWPVLGGLPAAHAAAPRFVLPPGLAAIPPNSPLLAAWRPALAAAAAAATAAAGAAARPMTQLGPQGFLGLPPGLVIPSTAAVRPPGTAGQGSVGVGQPFRLSACVPPFLPFPLFPVGFPLQPAAAAAVAAAATEARSITAAAAPHADSSKLVITEGGVRTASGAQALSPLQGPTGPMGAFEPQTSDKGGTEPSASPPVATAAPAADPSEGQEGRRASVKGLQAPKPGPSVPQQQQVVPTHPPGQHWEGSGGKKLEAESLDVEATPSFPTSPSLLGTPTPCSTGAKLSISHAASGDSEQHQQQQQPVGMVVTEPRAGKPPANAVHDRMAGIEEGLVVSSSGSGSVTLEVVVATPTAPDPSLCSAAPPCCPSKHGPTAGAAPPPASKDSTSHVVQTTEAPPQGPALPVPLPRAVDVVCERTLRELVALPPRNITLDREGAGDSGQVLTALELARQARIAANRAYLAGLGLGPKALHDGKVEPLPPDDPVVLQAARELAMQAAAEEARRQASQAQHTSARTPDALVSRALGPHCDNRGYPKELWLTRMRQRYESARRRRAKLEPALLRQLRELAEQESEAGRELAAAEAAAAELCGEEGGGSGLGRLGVPDEAGKCVGKAGVVVGGPGVLVEGAAAAPAAGAERGSGKVLVAALGDVAVEEGGGEVRSVSMGEGGIGSELQPQPMEVAPVM
ncbi:hypothetical protein N2152v2_007564 [Parachlorella kessleri]